MGWRKAMIDRSDDRRGWFARLRARWRRGFLLALITCAGCHQPAAPTALILEASGSLIAPNGLRLVYRTNGDGRPGARPALLILARAADDGFAGSYYPVAEPLVAEGWIALSVDMPGHGSDQRPGEPDGLTAWALRVAQGEDFVTPFVARLDAALAWLAAGGAITEHIAAAGYSRGGYIAFQVAARTHRVSAVAAFAPVTDVRALAEFATLSASPLAAQLAAAEQAPALAHVPLWIMISEDDDRVSTSTCSAFVSSVRRAGGSVAYTIAPGHGHTFPATAYGDATNWLRTQH